MSEAPGGSPPPSVRFWGGGLAAHALAISGRRVERNRVLPDLVALDQMEGVDLEVRAAPVESTKEDHGCAAPLRLG